MDGAWNRAAEHPCKGRLVGAWEDASLHPTVLRNGAAIATVALKLRLAALEVGGRRERGLKFFLPLPAPHYKSHPHKT